MTDRYPVADQYRVFSCDMQDAGVLDIRLMSDFYRIDVGSDHGLEPDARLFFDNRITYNDSIRSYVGGICYLRAEVLESVLHLYSLFLNLDS